MCYSDKIAVVDVVVVVYENDSLFKWSQATLSCPLNPDVLSVIIILVFGL
jgi:hypothetical protein